MTYNDTNELPSVVCLTATYGRHHYCCRALTYFLYQKYAGEHTMVIFNNSDIKYKLIVNEPLPPNKHVILVNNHLSYKTQQPYTSVGQIYNDAILYCTPYDVINMFDDDDMYLANHIRDGVYGYLRAKQEGFPVYMPGLSWEKCASPHPYLKENLTEPTCFASVKHVIEKGFEEDRMNTPHYNWFSFDKCYIFYDNKGVPTHICDVTTDTNLHISHPDQFISKSGDEQIVEDSKRMFEFYRQYQNDFGNGDDTIHPLSRQEMEQYHDFDYYL